MRQTHGWSFAYLNELRTTASILALDRGGDRPGTADVTEGLALLGPQFQAGRQNHVAPAGEQLGFGGG